MVMNLQKDRYRPCRKGQTKPIRNAPNVGITKTGQNRLIVFSIISLPWACKVSALRRASQWKAGRLPAAYRFFAQETGWADTPTPFQHVVSLKSGGL